MLWLGFPGDKLWKIDFAMFDKLHHVTTLLCLNWIILHYMHFQYWGLGITNEEVIKKGKSKNLKGHSAPRVGNSFGSHPLGIVIVIWMSPLMNKYMKWQVSLSDSTYIFGMHDICTSHGPSATGQHIICFHEKFALLLDQVPSELSAAGANQGVIFLQLPTWSPPDDPF